MASKLSALIGALAGKATPVDADKLPILDSAASGNFQYTTWANIKATLKTYFDTLYTSVAGVTVSSATPTVAFKDTNCTDADVNFDIVANATDTGSGAEDIDVAFSAQVAGTKVNFINFDADGVLALGYGGQKTYSAKLAAIRDVVTNTGTATPAATDSNALYTNEGDADGSVITLPTAAAGYSFTVYVQTAQTITVTANAGDTIRIANSVTAAAGSITSNVVGSSVTLEAINATEWVATAVVGTWSI